MQLNLGRSNLIIEAIERVEFDSNRIKETFKPRIHRGTQVRVPSESIAQYGAGNRVTGQKDRPLISTCKNTFLRTTRTH